MSEPQDYPERIAEICRHPQGSPAYNRGMTRLIQSVLRSGKLWQEATDYYADALQKTLLFLSQNLCGAYDPNRGSLATWMNSHLKWRLHDYRLERQQEKQNTVSPVSPLTGDTFLNWLENFPAPPDVPPIWEDTLHWAQTDPDGSLQTLHIRDRPDLTAQVLILRRLPPETDWKTLEAEFDCSYSTLASFYQRQCKPLLRNFAKSQGYIE
ncbi:MAG: sigma-70 family RNA polymerase sigma factor [Spirulina sp.]